MNRIEVAVLCVTAVVAAAACDVIGLGDDSPPDGLSLEVPQPTWEREDTIRVTLRNGTRRDLGYNLCIRSLERRVAGRWTNVRSMPENTACTAQLDLLRPGEQARGGQVIYSFIEGGRYRFRTRVEWPLGEGEVVLTSNPFEVAPR